MNQIDLWKETEDALREVVRIHSPTFLNRGRQEDVDSILDLLDHNELGEGFECLIALMMDSKVIPNEVTGKLLEESGNRMNIPKDSLELLLEQK